MSSFIGVSTKHSGYNPQGERVLNKGGGSILGSILSVASFFVPGLQPFAAAFNFINSAAEGNPLGMLTSGIGLAGGFGGMAGGGDFTGGAGGGWAEFGDLPGMGGSGGSFGDVGGFSGSFGDSLGGSLAGSVGDTISAGGDSGFDIFDGNLSGDLSNIDLNYDSTGMPTGAESTSGQEFGINPNQVIGDTGAGTWGRDLADLTATPGTLQDLSGYSQAGTMPELNLSGGGATQSLDSSGMSGDYSQTDYGGFGGDVEMQPYTGGSQMGAEAGATPSEGIFGKLQNKVSNMGMKDWLKVGKGLYGMYNEGQQQTALKKLAEQSANRADPFASQRPQYQGLLSQSYSPQGLQGLFNNEYMAGSGNQLMQQLQARDAAQGRRSQAGSRMAQLQSDFMSNYVPKYRSGLGNPSGANFGPDKAGQVYGSLMKPTIGMKGSGLADLFGVASSMF